MTSQNNEAVGENVYTLEGIRPTFAATLDAILVLGGGAPQDISSPPKWVMTRCDAAAEVFRLASTFFSDQQNNHMSKKLPAILTLSAGSAHAPQLTSADGLPIWEATSSASYLMDNYEYIPPSNIYVETTSYDTISNAYFARTSHTDISKWRNILVITSDFHMGRSKAIFDWIFSLDNDEEHPYILNYLRCDDTGMSLETLETRRAHEKKQQDNIVQNLAPNINTLREVWSFLTEKHDFYTASKLVKRGKGEGLKFSTALNDSYSATNRSTSSLSPMKGTNLTTILMVYSASVTLILFKVLWRQKA